MLGQQTDAHDTLCCRWRLTSVAVPLALKASLARMRLPKTSVYMQHWPGFLFNAFSNDAYIEGLALCQQQVSKKRRCQWECVSWALRASQWAPCCGPNLSLARAEVQAAYTDPTTVSLRLLNLIRRCSNWLKGWAPVYVCLSMYMSRNNQVLQCMPSHAGNQLIIETAAVPLGCLCMWAATITAHVSSTAYAGDQRSYGRSVHVHTAPKDTDAACV